MAEKWRLKGTVLDACNCTTLCPCNYAQPSTNPNECTAALAMRIEKGSYGKVKLDGLHVASVIWSPGDPITAGIEKAAWILDERATPEQRDALLEVFSGKAGGLFGMLASMVKQNLGVSFARFEYGNDEKAWSVKAGKFLEIKGGFLKPPPGMPLEAKPKRVETYDPFFGPTMEKTVGVTDKYTADVGGLKYSISGKYSSAGRFEYSGP